MGSGYVEVNDHEALDFSTAMSISLWVKPHTLDERPRGLVSKRIGAFNQLAYSIFFYNENRLYIDVDGYQGNERFSSACVFEADRWYYITLTYDATRAEAERVQLFVNGKLDTAAYESSTSIADSGASLTLGALNSNYGTYYDGLMDEVRLYERALSSDEIKKVYDERMSDQDQDGLSAYQENQLGFDPWRNQTTDQLQGWYQGDQPFGSLIQDQSVNKQDGHYLGEARAQYANGINGKSFVFDGEDDYIRIPDADHQDGRRQLSIGFWVKPERLAGYQGLVSKRITANHEESYAIYLGGDRIEVDIDGANNRFYSSSLDLNAWYHIMLTFDGTAPVNERTKLYINGVLDKTATESSAMLPDSSAPLLFGRSDELATDRYFKGAMDDIRLYNRTMDAQEVAAIHAERMADWDQDGLLNYEEALVGSDEHNGDTDYDGMSDYSENGFRVESAGE